MSRVLTAASAAMALAALIARRPRGGEKTSSVLVGLAFAMLACAGACSGPPSSSQASGAQAQSSILTQAADNNRVYHCQVAGGNCVEQCDFERQGCHGASCSDDYDACHDECRKQQSQCEGSQ